MVTAESFFPAHGVNVGTGIQTHDPGRVIRAEIIAEAEARIQRLAERWLNRMNFQIAQSERDFADGKITTLKQLREKVMAERGR